jgi:hypothetical protein
MLGFRGLRCEIYQIISPDALTDQLTASQKSDASINREDNILNQRQIGSPTPNTKNTATMSQAQNGDLVTQTNQISNRNIQLNGGTNGTVSSRKVTTLRDATQRAIAMYRTELGSSSEAFLHSCNSVETFFDYVAGIRLREMPHHSSRWDKVLKWAEFFAAQVFAYSEEVSQFADYSHEAAQIIWASSRSLLEVSIASNQLRITWLTLYLS